MRNGQPVAQEEDKTVFDEPVRQLPTNPEEFDKLLAPYRVMVRPLVGGISKICETLDSMPLDADEKEGGIQAFSALLYQYGGELDARVLVALWVAGVTMPRVLHYMQKDKAAKARQRDFGQAQRGGNAPLTVVEKEVNPPPQKTGA